MPAIYGFAHAFIVCSGHNFLLSSTQSAIASRDANIMQLEKRCEQLKVQVSLCGL